MNPQPIMTAKIISEAEIDRSLVKIILIGFLIVATVFSFTYFLDFSFKNFQFRYLFFAAASVAVALILIILSVFYIKSFNKLIIIAFLSSFISLASFYPNLSAVIVIGAFVFFVFFLLAYYRGFKVVNNLIKIRFFFVASSILPKAATAFLLFATFVFFNYYFDIESNRFNDNLNKIFVASFVKISEPVFKIFLSNFSFQDSTDELIKLVVEKRINSLIPDFSRYPSTVKEKILNEAFIEFKKNIEKQIGLVEGNKPFSETVFDLIKTNLDNLAEKEKIVFAIVFSFILFFIIKGISLFFYWLIKLLAFILFKALIAVNFAYISLENKSREFVILT